MCPRCRREYEDPPDRRFHAQPNACPRLRAAPRPVGRARERRWRRTTTPCRQAAAALTAGLDRRAQGARRLPVAGRRPQRRGGATPPRAEAPRGEAAGGDVPGPGALEAVRAHLADWRSGCSRRRRAHRPAASACRARARSAPSVAPGNPYLGVDAPLHAAASPADARSSASPSWRPAATCHDEPIVHRRARGVERLAGIADRFLVHDRPIERHVDDSVVRVRLGREMVHATRPRLRAAARSIVKRALPPLLAVGGHLKNTVAVSRAKRSHSQPAHRRPGDGEGAASPSARSSPTSCRCTT